MKLALAAAALVAALGGCGPALGGLPHPNSAIAAGAAAAVAAAITLADPSLAGHKPEADIDSNGKATPVQTTVPPDVFDRLDNPVGSDDDPSQPAGPAN